VSSAAARAGAKVEVELDLLEAVHEDLGLALTAILDGCNAQGAHEPLPGADNLLTALRYVRNAQEVICASIAVEATS
jgi:hypothetical protein